MRAKRINKILEYIKKRKECSLKELSKEFNVSLVTIRRDVDELLKEGQVKKVYGGVIYNKNEVDEELNILQTEPFYLREGKNINEKKFIGKLAASLVVDGDTIFIDSGTTTIHMIDNLSEKKKITVITHNINVVNYALNYANINIISVGGQINRPTNSLIGEIANKQLLGFNITKSFIATTGFSLDNGFTNSSILETPIKESVIRKSGKVFILIDFSKWNTVSLMNFVKPEKIDAIITNKKPPQNIIDFFNKNNTKIIYDLQEEKL